ncbi:hypothetical protein [Pelagibaculum spongiae]|uniref:Uncharacterized protein n=1 Tax=Pelagibaculum spongiae TaxID=2080658 RepID=A0A2V1GWG6_9GAMM|nr:hypothetical protein [Pelagibaculum spongiae]PVZ70350.1 hypothetical protein DC094_07075 [Pelagibaculum spongiae]
MKAAKNMAWKPKLIGFFTALIITFVLASISHSQQVLNQLQAIGIELSWQIRLTATFDDLLGLLPGYGAIIAISLLLGFAITHQVRQRILKKIFNKDGSEFSATVDYLSWGISGFLSMLVPLLLMKPLLDITLIAGARSTSGLLLQCLCGVLGVVCGRYIYQQLNNKTHKNITNQSSKIKSTSRSGSDRHEV